MLNPELLQRVGVASTIAELTSHVVAASEQLGFGLASGVWIEGRFGSPAAVVRAFGNPPDAFLKHAKSLPEGLRDPVLMRGLSMPGFLTWDQSTYVDAGAADLWDVQAVYGYRCGLSVALHAPSHAQAFIFGVDGISLPKGPVELLRLKAAVNLLTLHAHRAMANLVAHPVDEGRALQQIV